MSLAAFAAVPADAAVLQLFPTRFNLTPTTPTAVLTVVNRGDDGATLQLGVQQWQQVDGEDQLTPTRDVLANPGLFAVKGASQQIARLGLRVPPLPVERSYRLLVREVPPQTLQNGLTTLLTISVPVFVPPEKPVKGVEWRLRAGTPGPQLVIHNSGNVHVQLTSVKLTDARGATRADQSISFYVLPGATRVLPIKASTPVAAGAAMRLDVDTDQGAFSANLTTEAAGNAPTRP